MAPKFCFVALAGMKHTVWQADAVTPQVVQLPAKIKIEGFAGY
jgi:hypothetical protein